jgi:predicted transglutaminase-like cysteine proteinase
MNSIAKGLAAAVFGALALLGGSAASALDTTHVAFVQTATGTTSIPVGHAEFCRSRPAECRANGQIVDVMPLNDQLWSQLLQVNANWNAAVTPVSDADLYRVDEFWTYPNGYGDCEDYALAKRRDLINAGWPASVLLLAVVKQANGEGHAVLLVRTDRGDLVLDNQVGSVELWSNTDYRFIKRQSQADAGKWVDMIDQRGVVTATAAIP